MHIERVIDYLNRLYQEHEEDFIEDTISLLEDKIKQKNKEWENKINYIKGVCTAHQELAQRYNCEIKVWYDKEYCSVDIQKRQYSCSLLDFYSDHSDLAEYVEHRFNNIEILLQKIDRTIE